MTNIFTPDRIEDLSREELGRRLDCAIANHAIEGMNFTPEQTNRFREMIDAGLTGQQMREQLYAWIKHDLAKTPTPAE